MKLYHYILFAILAVVGACSSSDEPTGSSRPSASADETCDLVFTLEAEMPIDPEKRATRVDADNDNIWGNPYPEELGFDSERKIENISLYIATLSGDVIPLSPKLLNAGDGVYVYKTQINLKGDYITKESEDLFSFTGRIVAMANLGNVTMVSPFTTSPFNVSMIAESGVIPMWGVTTLTDLKLHKEETVDIGTLRMLRSVPKVTFKLDDDISDIFRIKSISTPYYDFELTGYCQPSGALIAATTGALSIGGCFNPAKGETGSVTKFYGLGSSQAWCYIGERECKNGADGYPPYFNVVLERRDGTGFPFSGKVYMCDYVSGEPDYATTFTRMVRNHDYQYVISLAKLEFVVSFREWIFGGKVHIELE